MRADPAVHHVARARSRRSRPRPGPGPGGTGSPTVSSLATSPSRSTPSWPCVVKGSSATSHITPRSGCAFFTARTARQTRFSGLSASSPSGGLALGRRRREKRDERNAERLRLAGRVDQRRRSRAGSTPGIDGDRRARRGLVMDEDRPDEIGRRQHMLGHEPARPVVAPVAAHADARIGARGDASACSRGAMIGGPGFVDNRPGQSRPRDGGVRPV